MLNVQFTGQSKVVFSLQAVERCLLLSDQTACSGVLKEIATSLLTHFVANHLEYAIDFYTANRFVYFNYRFKLRDELKLHLMRVFHYYIEYHECFH